MTAKSKTLRDHNTGAEDAINASHEDNLHPPHPATVRAVTGLQTATNDANSVAPHTADAAASTQAQTAPATANHTSTNANRTNKHTMACHPFYAAASPNTNAPHLPRKRDGSHSPPNIAGKTHSP